MDDQVAVGMIDRVGRLAEQRQARRERQRPIGAMIGDRRAGDMLHDEVGGALRCGAPVEHQRDMRMAQPRQDAPFGSELGQRGLGEDRLADQLDRDPVLEQPIVAFGQIDDAHAAAPDLLDDPVIADPFGWRRVIDDALGQGRDGRQDHRRLIGRGHRPDRLDQDGIRSGLGGEPGVAFGFGPVEHRVIEAQDASLERHPHGQSAAFNSLNSQARAIRQRLSAVLSEMASSRAISSIVSPT